jgi:hypothetical protein
MRLKNYLDNQGKFGESLVYCCWVLDLFRHNGRPNPQSSWHHQVKLRVAKGANRAFHLHTPVSGFEPRTFLELMGSQIGPTPS